MLTLLQKELKIGNICFKKTKKWGYIVLLVENDQKKLSRWLEIFSEYPPLTTRVQCQLQFFLHYYGKKEKNILSQYFLSRNKKYENQVL